MTTLATQDSNPNDVFLLYCCAYFWVSAFLDWYFFFLSSVRCSIPTTPKGMRTLIPIAAYTTTAPCLTPCRLSCVGGRDWSSAGPWAIAYAHPCLLFYPPVIPRSRPQFQESPVYDFLSALLCCCCMLAQDGNEIKAFKQGKLSH